MSFKKWEEIKLGELFIANYGKSLPKKLRIDGEYNVYGSGGITGTHKDKLVNGPGIIIGRKGTVGALYYEEGDYYPIDTVYYVEKSAKYNLKFLYYKLKTMNVDKMNTHSAVPGLNREHLYSQTILIPELEEQKAIAKVLSDLDKKIETNNEINKKLEEMAQAIFKQWFVDFEFPNEDGKPYKSSGGEMVESELGMIPKGWKNKELKETIKFNKGKKPKIITDKEFDNSKLYLTIDVLNRNSIQYAINDKVVLANKKDILMVMDGASSGSLYYGLDGIVGSTLSKLVINDEYINEDVLYYFLKLNEFNIKGHLTGSAIPHTDKEYVNRLIICIPNDKQLLVRVTKILSDIREKVIINNEENSRLITLRDTLLPKLMSGEIRVPLD